MQPLTTPPTPPPPRVCVPTAVHTLVSVICTKSVGSDKRENSQREEKKATRALKRIEEEEEEYRNNTRDRIPAPYRVVCVCASCRYARARAPITETKVALLFNVP